MRPSVLFSWPLFLLCLLALLGGAAPAAGQTVPSNCAAPDSVLAKYRDDAYRLAVRKIYRRHLPARDSIGIARPHADTVLRALLAVYNATALPARDSVVRQSGGYGIHSFPNPELHILYVAADSGLSWMRQLRRNQAPTGTPAIDRLLARYHLRPGRYYDFSAAFGYDLAGLETDSSYNLYPLTNLFAALPGVRYAYPEGYAGDGDNLTDSIYADHVELTYSIGRGDCPAGCTYRKYWKFNVYFDCSVQFVRSYDSSSPPATGLPPAPAAADVAVYPIPFEKTLLVSGLTAPFSYVITNVLGQAVAAGTAASGQTIGALDRLPPGGYTLTISADHRILHRKVWKQ